MARPKRREPTKQVTVSLPIITVEEIDVICGSNMITRTSYIFSAVKEKLERDRSLKERDIITKLSSE